MTARTRLAFSASVGFVVGLAAWWVYGWPVTMLWFPPALAVFAAVFVELLPD